MGAILDFLKGLVSKTYRFFAPAISATSTAVDESVIVEFAKQSGKAVQTVTNGLGECVGYTSTSAIVSNGESTVVGTVIDFTSKQVLVTEELAASTSVAGGETVAVGSTVTEIAGTATTTTMLATPVATVGSCVLTAIAGLEVGKKIGEYLQEKNPDFWVGIVGKALFDAGCTIGLFDNGGKVITYMDVKGQTSIPKKAVSVIKNELAKVGAIQNNEASIIKKMPQYGVWYEEYCMPDNVPYSCQQKISFSVINREKNSPFVFYKDGLMLSCLPVKFFIMHTSYYGAGYEGFCICAYIITKDVFELNKLALHSTYFANTARIYQDLNNKKEAISIFPIEQNGYNLTTFTFNDILTAFTTQVAPITHVLERPDIDFYRTNDYHLFTDEYRYLLNEVPSPQLDPAKEPQPIRVPRPKIKPETVPDTDDDDSKAVPISIPDYLPQPIGDFVPSPKKDPVVSKDPIADNPNPHPNPNPNPEHIPDIPEPVPKTPDLPPVPVVPNMVASALSRVFNPTQAQLDALGQYLWSASRLEDLLKLFQNPVDGIISLHAIYGTPSINGEAEIKLGYLPTGVSAAVVTSQFVIIDCGTININEQYKNATDYAPYTTVQIYLPFIGIQNLNPFDIVGSSIKCTYKIDVYTGACIAQLNVERSGLNGVIYEFSGNCSYQIPLTSGSYLQAVANVIGGAVAGTAVAGGAGAVIGAGRAMLHSNVDIARSGNLSSNAGILGNRKPYFIITRSIPHDALSYSKYYGFPSNKTVYLHDCTGFTRVKDIILHTSATQEERDEIMKLLKTGIYI